jgi:2-polyprenyl-3-methyl-5-hydroxy-6-metoxy-1,4-benzoquinol methylase
MSTAPNPLSPPTDDPRPLVWDDTTLARFWAYQARFPDIYFSFQKGADVVRRARHYLPQAARVLDYGCGPGHLLPHLAKAGYRVVGADIAIGVMGDVQARLATAPGFEGIYTVDDLLSRNDAFDAIFLLEVVEHLDDRWLETTLSNARRLLKPKGVLIVTTPNEERLEDSTVYCPVANVVFHRWQHMRSWTASSLEATLRQHGFHNVTARACNFRDATPASGSVLDRLVARVMVHLRKPQSLFAVCNG